MSLIVADGRGHTDGSMHRLLEMVECKLPIVLMSRTGGFVFNEELRRLGAYVLCEVSELGWDWEITESHTWGGNTEKFPQYQSEEYKKFDEWVAQNPPVFTLQRELLENDVTDTCLPIDYPMWYQVPPPVSREEFESRPLAGFYFWGRSHEERLRLHAKMWYAASEYGFSVCDNPYYLEKFIAEEQGIKFASFNIPHYARMPMEQVLAMQSQAKISIAMPGAGVKTFRHAEASYNAVMLKLNDNLAWSYKWDMGNCIISVRHSEIEEILWRIKNAKLYEIYCNGIENCRRYQADNYVRDYLNPILAAV